MADDTQLDQPATPDALAMLRSREVLSVEAFRSAAALAVRPPRPATWRAILDPLALVLGIALIVSGVLYVVAFNWTELGRFSKVAVGLAPVLVVGGLALVWGNRTLVGQVLITAGIPLTLGALLAVGLAYPVVGSPAPLLVIWAVLAVPWAIAARLGAAWLVVMLAVDVALGSVFGEAVTSYEDNQLNGLILAWTAAHAAGWALFVGLRALRVGWAKPWVRQALIAPALLLLAGWPVLWLAVHTWSGSPPLHALTVLGTCVFVLVGIVVQLGFALKRFGAFPAAIQLLSALVVLTTALGRVMVAALDDDLGGLFLTLPFGVLMLVALAACAGWLVWGWRRQRPS